MITPKIMETPMTSNQFIGMPPFKVEVNIGLPLFKFKMDTNALKKWLSLIKGSYSIFKKLNTEKITSTLLKSLPHFKYWWDTFSCIQDVEYESKAFGMKPT